MEIVFDPAKDETNRIKHGVSLAAGAVVLANLVTEFPDPRHTAEIRMIAFGMIGGRLMACVYTRRGSAARIISVRKANRKEQRKWLGSM